MHPTGPILAFQLNMPEIFSEALASPPYMVATPMPICTVTVQSDLTFWCEHSSTFNDYTVISTIIFVCTMEAAQQQTIPNSCVMFKLIYIYIYTYI